MFNTDARIRKLEKKVSDLDFELNRLKNAVEYNEKRQQKYFDEYWQSKDEKFQRLYDYLGVELHTPDCTTILRKREK